MTDSSDPRRIWDAVSTDVRESISVGLGLTFDPEALEVKNNFTYVPHELVRQALIDATGNQFDWTIDNVYFRDDNVLRRSVNRETGEIPSPTVMVIVGTLTIPGLGSRAGIGAHAMDAGSGEDAAYKSAESDALKRAAMAFGVGLKQLYIDKARGSQQRQSAPPQNRSRSPQPEQREPLMSAGGNEMASHRDDPYAGDHYPPVQEYNEPVQQSTPAVAGEFIPPNKDQSGRNVWTLPDRVRGSGKASDRQLNWIFDLLHKMQKNPYAYDWSDLPTSEASEWIDSLQQGKVPFES